MTKEEIIKRRHDIYEMREKGMKFREIAEIYGLSVERVRQIYLKEVRIIDYASRGLSGWGYYK